MKQVRGLTVLLFLLAAMLASIPAFSQQPFKHLTASAQVTVTSFVDIVLGNAPIEFPSLVPGSSGNATSGKGFPLFINITENTNAMVNLSANASDHFRAGSNSFNIANLTYANNTTGGFNKTMLLAENTTDPFTDWVNITPPGIGNTTTRTAYFYLSIPPQQPAGTYNTTITVKGTQVPP